MGEIKEIVLDYFYLGYILGLADKSIDDIVQLFTGVKSDAITEDDIRNGWNSFISNYKGDRKNE